MAKTLIEFHGTTFNWLVAGQEQNRFPGLRWQQCEVGHDHWGDLVLIEDLCPKLQTQCSNAIICHVMSIAVLSSFKFHTSQTSWNKRLETATAIQFHTRNSTLGALDLGCFALISVAFMFLLPLPAASSWSPGAGAGAGGFGFAWQINSPGGWLHFDAFDLDILYTVD